VEDEEFVDLEVVSHCDWTRAASRRGHGLWRLFAAYCTVVLISIAILGMVAFGMILALRSKSEETSPLLPLRGAEQAIGLSEQGGHGVAGRTGQATALLRALHVCARCDGPGDLAGHPACFDRGRGPPQAIYCVGVGHHDRWCHNASARYDAPAYFFDRGDRGISCRGCTSRGACSACGGGRGAPLEGDRWTLGDALNQTEQGGAGPGRLMMKIGIGGSEWPTPATGSREVLRKFGQVVLEFHGANDADRQAHYVNVMRLLRDAGLQVAHVRGDGAATLEELRGTALPDVLEVMMLNTGKQAASSMC